jgi:hypothetical protein
MRLASAAILVLIGATSVQAQGTSSPGGAAAPSAPAARPAPSSPAPGAAQPNAVNPPASPPPGAAGTPVDPGRNNVDANPPTRRLDMPPSAAPPVTAQPNQLEPGASASQPRTRMARPGAAQSGNSDGYAECMAMWSGESTRMSRDEWSRTCERARLPRR